MKRIVLLWLAIPSLLWGQANRLVLFDKGTSNYVVTIPTNATDAESRAASFFRYYVKQATEFNLPISTSSQLPYCIQIATDRQLPEEGFRVYVQFPNLMIQGGLQNGAINGVRYVLKKFFGVDFLAVGEVYTEAPATIIVPAIFDVQQSPSFSMRTIHSLEGYDPDYQERQALQVPYIANSAFANSFNREILPPSSYFKTNPDYYIRWNGRRDTAQPDVSNEKVFQLALTKIRSVARQSASNKPVYNMNLNDNPKFDQVNPLSNNAQSQYAGNYYRFVNRLAASLPAEQFVALAYEQTKNAVAAPALRYNVRVMLTNADNDKSKPITIADLDVQQHLNMKQQIPAWLQKDADLILWDYLANYTNSIMPWPNLYTLQPTLQYYRRTGVKNLFLQNAGRFPSENSELKAYLCANLMWDADCNADSLIQTFCKHFYLKSWNTVYQYIHQINKQALASKESMYTYDGPAKFRNTLFAWENITKWRSLLYRAEQNAETSLVQKRIMKERLGLDAVYLELSVTQSGWNQADSKAQLLQKLQGFRQDAKNWPLPYLTEAQPLEFFINQLQQKLQ